jgi:hypothetical protein
MFFLLSQMNSLKYPLPSSISFFLALVLLVVAVFAHYLETPDFCRVAFRFTGFVRNVTLVSELICFYISKRDFVSE